MTYYIYLKDNYLNKQASAEKTLVGCFAVTEKEGKISNFKFTFQEIDFNIENIVSEIKKYWKWAFTSEFHIWANEVDSLPEIIQNAVNEHFHQAFQNEINFLTSKSEIKALEEIEIPENCPAFLLESVTDIKKNLVLALGKEPSELEFRVAISIRLFKISTFLEENPEYVFEFPIYQAYIKKHGLSIHTYEVEEFLEDINKAIQVGLVE